MLGLFVVFIMFGFPIAFTLMALGVFFGYFAMGDLDLPAARAALLFGDDQRRADLDPVVRLHGLHHRARQHSRPAVPLAAARRRADPGRRSRSRRSPPARSSPPPPASSAPCVTLMGLLAFPAMLRAGYDVKIAAGVVCAGGCLGILIPPSVMLILYGATAGVSVVKLYAGAFFPGHHAGRALHALYVSSWRCSIRSWRRSCRRKSATSRSARCSGPW